MLAYCFVYLALAKNRATAERFWFCVSFGEIHIKSLLKTFPRLALGSRRYWFHKDLSNPYREGIDEKLKCVAQPYKTKLLKKVDKVLC